MDSLGVSSRIGDDNEPRFFEGTSDVVGKVSWSEATGDGDCAGVCGELEDGTLTVRTSRDCADVSWIVDGDNDARGQDDLLPGYICKYYGYKITNMPAFSIAYRLMKAWAIKHTMS